MVALELIVGAAVFGTEIDALEMRGVGRNAESDADEATGGGRGGGKSVGMEREGLVFVDVVGNTGRPRADSNEGMRNE